VRAVIFLLENFPKGKFSGIRQALFALPKCRMRLSLGELACATSCLETVLLSFLHSGVSCEETCLLEERTVCVVSEEESSGNAVADCACLTGDTTTVNVSNDVKLTCCVCYAEGLVDDELECFKTEVIVNVTIVDCDLACTGIESNASYGALSSARTIEIRFSTCIHYLYLSFLIFQLRTEQAAEPAACVRSLRIP